MEQLVLEPPRGGAAPELADGRAEREGQDLRTTIGGVRAALGQAALHQRQGVEVEGAGQEQRAEVLDGGEARIALVAAKGRR